MQPQPLTDLELFEQLLEKANADELKQYMLIIDDENEYRKLKDKRIARLRVELKKEKQRLNNRKSNIPQIQEESEEEEATEEELPKKNNRRRKK